MFDLNLEKKEEAHIQPEPEIWPETQCVSKAGKKYETEL